MSSSIAVAAGSASSHVTAGVGVAVLREALDLMRSQGEAIVTMIDAASVASDITAAGQPRFSDPSLGQHIDLLA